MREVGKKGFYGMAWNQGNRERPAGVSVSRGTKEKVRSGPWNRANSCPPQTITAGPACWNGRP